MTPILRLTLNCPDRATAERIATALIESRLVAAANLHADITSIYHWRGQVVTATEVPLVLITHESLWAEVSANVLRLHPYEVPPLSAQRLDLVSESYADWVSAITLRD